MKHKLTKKSINLFTAFVLIFSLFQFTGVLEVDAAISSTKTFNVTGSGQYGSNTNNSSGSLGGTVTMVDGGVYLWTVPYKGLYEVETFGAQGGTTSSYIGGKGSRMKGDFVLNAGEVIRIVVGQQGNIGNPSWGATGGGGTFVWKDGLTTPLIISGGGGGAGPVGSASNADATTSTSGQPGTGGSPGFGGTNGSVGNGGSCSGGGGNGWDGGVTKDCSTNVTYSPIRTSANGLATTSGYTGSYGGGGGSYGGSGGGGGYSGGGGGGWSQSGYSGGGGSYNSGTSQSNTAGANSGQGKVIINLIQPEANLLSPADNFSFQQSFVDFDWDDASSFATNKYEVRVGTSSGSTTGGGTYAVNVSNYKFDVPLGTAGNTTFYWSVRAKDNYGTFGPWSDERRVVYANNVTDITTTFDITKKRLTTSLNERVTSFSVNNVIDPDVFNYVKVFADIKEVSGSNKQLGVDTPTPIIWSKKDYKLKIIPDFSVSANNFDLVVVDYADENIILATLVNDRPMQEATDALPEKLTLRLFGVDYQKTNNSRLTPDNLVKYKEFVLEVDTRNYFPVLTDIKDDVNGRLMSANQGFNKIKLTGNVTDLDPSDDVELFYTVKEKDDMTDGVYLINPSTDVKIKSFKASDFTTGVNSSFDATYTVSDDYENGDYVVVVYSKDHRGGISKLNIIDFSVDRSNPEIKFSAEYGENYISTPERQVVPKDSKFKMYFSAYDYVTFEYVGYLIKSDQQKSSGTYEDLKIRGAFTNEVESSFIGVDLKNDMFEKGDMLVFKFRAISASGVIVEKDVRLLIGDETTTLSKLEDMYLPLKLQ
jgi:hypothetical protein